MSYRNEVTFSCDACDTDFIIDEDTMELPPGWLGMQIIVVDTDGCIPEHEREIFSHFCSQECLVEYVASDGMRQRLCMVDKPLLDNDDEDPL